MLHGEIVEPMAAPGGIQEIRGDHGVPQRTLQLHAVLLENLVVIFDVMADFGQPGIGKKRPQTGKNFLHGQLAGQLPPLFISMAHGNIPGALAAGAEGNTDKLRGQRVKRGSLRVEYQQRRLCQAGADVPQLLHVPDQHVASAVHGRGGR